MRKVSNSFLLSVIVLAISSCSSPPEIDNSLVLLELEPLPRTVVVKQRVEFEPIYSVLKIIEVSEVNGVQKFFLVKIGSDRTGIAVGTTGEIAEDQEFSKVIGIFKITEVYGDFFKCRVEELTYKIGLNAFVRYKIGEKVKEGE